MLEFPLQLSRLRTQHSFYEDAGSIPGLVQCVNNSALLQATAQVCNCISNCTPSLGTSICHKCGCKMKKEKNKQMLTRSCTVGENANDIDNMENNMEVPQKIKSRTTIQSSNSTSWYYSEKNSLKRQIHTHTHTHTHVHYSTHTPHTHVHYSIIYNSPNVETT